MYLIKSLGNAPGLVGPGSVINWVTGQYGIVDDNYILDYQNDPAAWTVIAGPDFKDVMIGLTGSSSAGNGSVPTASGTAGVTVEDTSLGGGLHQTTLTLADVAITMTDAGAAGTHGSMQLLDFPAGNILFLGAVSDVALVSDAAGLDADAELVAGVGTATAGTDNATLTGTEQDLIPSTAATLTASVGAFDGVSLTAGVAAFDGTSTAKDAFLNLAAPDADTDADDEVTANGTVTLTWINLGDN